MATSSAVPDDLYTYSNACVNLDNQLQGFAQGTLQQAILQYRMRCPSFPLPAAVADYPRFHIPEVDWAVEAGGEWLPGGIASYAANNANVDAWVANVASAFVDAAIGDLGEDGGPMTMGEIREIQAESAKTLTVDDGALEYALELPALEAQQAADEAQEEAGASFASKFNSDMVSDWTQSPTSDELFPSYTFTGSELHEIEANADVPYFDAGVLNNLSPAALQQLESWMQTPPTPASDARQVAEFVANAYSTGLLDPSVTQQLYTDLVTNSPDTQSADQYLMPALAQDSTACDNFLSQLSASQISQWNSGDNGGNGYFSQAAAASMAAHIGWYANQTGGDPPFSGDQLTALAAAAGAPENQNVLAPAAANWISSHVPGPGASGNDWATWSQQLTNVVNAFAYPTGQNVQSQVQMYWWIDFAALTVGGVAMGVTGGAAGALGVGATAATAAGTAGGVVLSAESLLPAIPNPSGSRQQYTEMIMWNTEYTAVAVLLKENLLRPTDGSQITGNADAVIRSIIGPPPSGGPPPVHPNYLNYDIAYREPDGTLQLIPLSTVITTIEANVNVT